MNLTFPDFLHQLFEFFNFTDMWVRLNCGFCSGSEDCFGAVDLSMESCGRWGVIDGVELEIMPDFMMLEISV